MEQNILSTTKHRLKFDVQTKGETSKLKLCIQNASKNLILQ